MLWVDPNTNNVSIGIQPHVFERYSRQQAQLRDLWCWAACVEMVGTFLGFPASAQLEIVEDAANGLANNRAGSVDEVRTALENLGQSWNKRFHVNDAISMELDARDYSPQRLGELTSEILTQEIPLIALIGAHEGIGHFVVLTEIRYRSMQNKDYIQAVYYDPWPTGNKQKQARCLMQPWSLFCRKSRYLIKVALS